MEQLITEYRQTLAQLERLLAEKRRQRKKCLREIHTIQEEIRDVQYALSLMERR